MPAHSRKAHEHGLTPKQADFVKEYLKDMNATQAAIRAGYSKTSANRIGPGLLGKTCISNAIQKERSKAAKRLDISVDRVLLEMARLAFSDIRKAVSFGPDGVIIKQDTEIDDDTAACISEVSENMSETGGSRKIKLYSKEKALEQLAKHLGLFEQRENADDAKSLFEKMREYASELAEATKGTPKG